MNGKTMLNGVPYFSDTQVIELTRAEYDVLPNSKYTDGVLYCIKDEGVMKGDTFSPIIYSLAEREVGVWTDGKPLYQKTVFFQSGITLTQYSWTDIYDASQVSIEKLVDFIPYTFNQVCPFGLYLSELNSSNHIRIVCLQNWAISGFTFRYTKTTDNPGTGKWTTSGVPAHHYSTEEQVIGTWIDGKTLYEKTIIDNTSHTSGSINIAHNISNIDEVTNITGVFSFGTDTWYYPISFADDPSTSNTNSVFKFCGINKVTNTILLYAGSNYGGTVPINKIRITIQYTKTS